jgi:glycosyltransferase involved in cell wall biosynthesis
MAALAESMDVVDIASVPKVSILLLAYRNESTIHEAMAGALAQTVPCEIIVSDDASGDAGYDHAVAAARHYSGPHRLIVRRNESNQGLCEHINIVAKIASGDIFVFMAGDDISYPHRVEKELAAFAAHPDAYVIGSTVDDVDSTNNKIIKPATRGLNGRSDQKRLLHFGKLATLLGASMALRRELFDRFPPLVGRVEDNMLMLRATLLGTGFGLPEPLLRYRQHDNNLNAWVYSRDGDRATAFRRRYERTIAMYREIANDHEKCIAAMPDLEPEKKRIAEQLVAMYRIEADSREAILNLPRRAWIAPIWRGLKHPGLRRKSAERALKFFLPRRLFGITRQ